MKSPHRKIQTRSNLLTPDGFDREVVERWVRRWTRARIDLDRLEFHSWAVLPMKAFCSSAEPDL